MFMKKLEIFKLHAMGISGSAPLRRDYDLNRATGRSPNPQPIASGNINQAAFAAGTSFPGFSGREVNRGEE
jgi:hypothetical protein